VTTDPTLLPDNLALQEQADFVRSRDERWRLFPRAFLVGIVAGLLAVAFRYVLAFGEGFRSSFVSWAHQWPSFGWLLTLSFGAVGAGVAVYLVRRGAPEAAGSGIPFVEAVLHGYRSFPWQRILPVKFFGGLAAMSGGLAMGREGPTVQMGACVGEALSGSESHEARTTLIAAGSGAGLAAAFNAPLAGLVFVLEELQKDFKPNVLGAAFLACAAADTVSRFIGGQLPAVTAPTFSTPPLPLLPAFAVLGLICGLLGVVFNKCLMATLNGYAVAVDRFGLLPAIAMGAVVGLITYFTPEWVGSGHSLAEAALAGKVIFATIPLLFLLRFVLTLGSYGTGAAGGIFAPFLAFGALFGLGCGILVQRYAPGLHDVVPGSFAAIAMAAVFTSIVRAPLTGIVLIVEMTASYSLMLPLLVACLVSYLVAEALRDMPIYEALLQRDLNKSGISIGHSQKEPFEVAVVIQPGSHFEGKRVRDLGLGSGIILTGIREHGQEIVPQANTLLFAHMKVRAVVSPDAHESLERLREGAHEPKLPATQPT
jgi:CIC family chloride channel protein